MTLQCQASIADYPGLAIEPNLGDYYLCLDRYTLGWQMERFALQYGQINLSFDAGLLQFGLGFDGICLDGQGSNQTRQWTIFHGTTANSFGLGISLLETTGGSAAGRRRPARTRPICCGSRAAIRRWWSAFRTTGPSPREYCGTS